MGQDGEEFGTKNLGKARRIAQEMAETERYYVEVLNSILDVFVPIFFANTRDEKSPEEIEEIIVSAKLNQKEHKMHPALFGQLREMCKALLTIRRFQNVFYNEVMQSVETLQLGGVIRRNLDFLEIYSNYYVLYESFLQSGGFRKYENSSNTTKKRLDKIRKTLETNKELVKGTGKLQVETLFDNIWQRLPRYKLLLGEYAKEIPAAIPDAKVAKKAYSDLEMVLSMNNDKMGNPDCISILSRISNPENYARCSDPDYVPFEDQNNQGQSQSQRQKPRFVRSPTMDRTVNLIDAELARDERNSMISQAKLMFDVRLYGYLVSENSDQAIVMDSVSEGSSNSIIKRSKSLNLPSGKNQSNRTISNRSAASGKYNTISFRTSKTQRQFVIVIADTAFKCVEKEVRASRAGSIKQCLGNQKYEAASELHELLKAKNMNSVYAIEGYKKLDSIQDLDDGQVKLVLSDGSSLQLAVERRR